MKIFLLIAFFQSWFSTNGYCQLFATANTSALIINPIEISKVGDINFEILVAECANYKTSSLISNGTITELVIHDNTNNHFSVTLSNHSIPLNGAWATVELFVVNQQAERPEREAKGKQCVKIKSDLYFGSSVAAGFYKNSDPVVMTINYN